MKIPAKPGQATPRPTDGELAILHVLWTEGACTVRQLRDKLSESRPTGNTTVLKLLQIMMEKGLVVRDESRRTHVYRARHPEDRMQQGIVLDLLGRAFGGSAQKLVTQAFRPPRFRRRNWLGSGSCWINWRRAGAVCPGRA